MRATFDTPTVQFGDAIGAHIVVVLDATGVRAGSLQLVDDAAPLTPISTSETSRTTEGNRITIAVARTFSCLSSACIAASGDATPKLPRVTATVLARDGTTLRAAAAWPALRVQGRVSNADLARARPPFRASTTPAPPTYRIAPATLAWLLDGVAIALVLAAAALLASYARRLARRSRVAAPADELERALRLAREAETRPPPDRRRALGLLARVLRARATAALRHGERARLGKTASRSPRRVATFVTDVEREVPS